MIHLINKIQIFNLLCIKTTYSYKNYIKQYKIPRNAT